jgi:putative PIN family toxin of toxin-antitoxin system
VRVVLDANVLVSAVISQAGPPREIVTAWVEERFELIASPALLDEVRDVLARPRLRRWVSTEVAAEFVDGLAQDVLLRRPARPAGAGRRSRRRLPDRAAGADYLVSGDRHLLDLGEPNPPVLTPRQFLDRLGA